MRTSALARSSSNPRSGGELRLEDLKGDRAIVLEIVGEIDRGHSAAAELALDRVAARKGRPQAF
jgi:hypothetical protein